MDSISVEERFGVSIATHPKDANFVIDTKEEEILRFTSYSEKQHTFHISTDNLLLTVSKEIAPSNRYYLATTETLVN